MEVSGQVPRWRPREHEIEHFESHRAEIGVDTPERYTASALRVIRTGRRFTYVDSTTGLERVGYFHRPTRRLTVLTADELFIVGHYRCEGGAAYVRGLDESTY